MAGENETAFKLIADSLKDIKEDTRQIRSEAETYRAVQRDRMDKMAEDVADLKGDVNTLKVQVGEALPLARDWQKTKWFAIGGGTAGGGILGSLLARLRDSF